MLEIFYVFRTLGQSLLTTRKYLLPNQDIYNIITETVNLSATFTIVLFIQLVLRKKSRLKVQRRLSA